MPLCGCAAPERRFGSILVGCGSRGGQGRDADRTGRIRGALIFSVDSGKTAFDSDTLQNPYVRLWTTNPGIVVDTATLRGEAYHDPVWERLIEDLGAEIEVIRIRDADLLEAAAAQLAPRILKRNAAGGSDARSASDASSGIPRRAG